MKGKDRHKIINSELKKNVYSNPEMGWACSTNGGEQECI
jgi:hypothetical protein